MNLDWNATVPAWATIITIVGTAAATFAGVLLAFNLERRAKEKDRRSAAANDLRGLFLESRRVGNLPPRIEADLSSELDYPFTRRAGVIQNELEAIDHAFAGWSIAVNATLVASHLFGNDYRTDVYNAALDYVARWDRRNLPSEEIRKARASLGKKLRPPTPKVSPTDDSPKGD